MSRLLSLMKKYCVELLMAGLFFVAASYYYNGSNKNHISRFDTIFSFVEPGTMETFSFRINGFIRDPHRGINTLDWAQNPEHDNNFYSNKAPGPAMLGIPVYAVLYWIQDAAGVWPETPPMTIVNCYLINLFVTVIPVTISAVCFFWLLLPIFDGRRRWPILLTVALYFGTLMLPYSTQFWGHTLAAAFVVIGLHQLQRESRTALFLSGLFFGMGVLCEYSVAITVLLVVPYVLCRKYQLRPDQSDRPALDLKREGLDLGWFILGGLPMLLVFMAYHHVCFGSPFTIANFHNNPYFKTTGAVGGLFQLKTLGTAFHGLLFSTYRGLFPHMPATLVVFTSIPFVYRLRKQPLFWFSLVNIIGFFVMNMTFNGWHGGDCLGPRYLIPALPFYIILGALGIRRLQCALPAKKVVNYALSGVFALLLLGSISNMFIATAVSPLAEEKSPKHNAIERQIWNKPLYYYYILFGKGIVKPHTLVFIRFELDTVRARALRSFDFGEFMGLKGWRTSVPFLLVYILGLGGLAYLGMRDPRSEATPTVEEDTKDESAVA